ncbi:MAG: site-specific integrase [Gammaproteobacteria bacterium]|nr:site-specific integrase [Gammaproteobacteria bacterium]
MAAPLPRPLFDTLENCLVISDSLHDYIASLNIAAAEHEFKLCLEFLKSYANSADTFNAYRRETERFLNWAWLINKKSLKEITRNDIRDYLQFVNNPPKNWIAIKSANRFIIDANKLRIVNPEWRPFIIRATKIGQRLGKKPEKENYQLSNKSIEAIFAGISTLYSFLQQENYLEVNPVSLIRQKKAYIQRQQVRRVTRKLSKLQWHTVISAAEEMAASNPQHQRTLFLMSAFYLLGLRISEVAYIPGRLATMGNFAPDKEGLWWYTTIGKGNKLRDIAVPDELLDALKSYRTSLNLPPLPSREEPTPLLPKLKGKHGLGSRQIRYIVQDVFDQAIYGLLRLGKKDEAEDLASATVHWLRHTAISTDVESRPREHIRDDVGHANPSTMDKYIDIDRVARHKSAQHKQLKPKLEKT